jgi:hypothetical protein
VWLGDCGEPGQATFADLTGMHTITGKLDEALAQLDNVQSWNLGLRLALYFYQK